MNDRLAQTMKNLAAESLRVDPPAALESRVLAEFDRVHLRRKMRRFWVPVAAVAAVVLAVLWLPQQLHAPKPPARVSQRITLSDQPFVPIPYVTQVGPGEQIGVMRVELPVAALIAAGLPVPSADTGGTAEADIVVGQDGRPRAVRLVAISTF